MIYEDAPEIGHDPHRERPRKASRREVGYALNRLALALSSAQEQLSELRHELGVAERLEVKRRKVGVE